jgi:uncharacterized protein (DUF1501 family)
MSTKNIDRRKFIHQASCMAVGGTTLLSSMLNLKAMTALANNSSSVMMNCNDQKALVCLFNSGGLDSYNMLIPTTPNEYNTYASVRSNQALALSTLRAINPLNTPGRTFGLNPAMANIQSLFNQGKAAFIANIGSLVTPITKQEYYDGTVISPLGLFSHSDQQMHWQTGFAHKRDAVGWAGKMSDLLTSCNSNINLPMNFSLSGSNTLQTGNESVEYTINTWNPTGGIESDYVNPMYNWWLENLKKNSLTNMLDETYVNIFEQTYKNTLKKSRTGVADINSAFNAAPSFDSFFNYNTYSDSGEYLKDAFKYTARLISQQSLLGMNRQIYFIDYGGWDHHDELIVSQETMLKDVDNGIGAFMNAINSINRQNSVTLFTLSEFGRTLTSNGNGTDHAWGGNVFVLGGAVNGQKIYGEYPTSLELDGPNEVGGGVFIPTTAAEEYFAELALWFGISPSSLTDIFPNLPNFFSGQGKPIGFMN